MKKSILVFVVAMMVFTGMANAQGARNLPPRPTLTGPVADLLNAIVVAINKQDKAFIDKVVAPNATWADEDVHIFPASFFINKLMQGMPRKLTITNVAGETWDTGAWAAYDYTLDETRADDPRTCQPTCRRENRSAASAPAAHARLLAMTPPHRQAG